MHVCVCVHLPVCVNVCPRCASVCLRVWMCGCMSLCLWLKPVLYAVCVLCVCCVCIYVKCLCCVCDVLCEACVLCCVRWASGTHGTAAHKGQQHTYTHTAHTQQRSLARCVLCNKYIHTWHRSTHGTAAHKAQQHTYTHITAHTGQYRICV